MFKTAILFSSLVFSPLSFATPTLDITNADDLLGQCESQAHLGNSGYILSSVNVSRNADEISFSIPVVNMACRQSSKSPTSMEWMIEAPQTNLSLSEGQISLRLESMTGLLYQEERFTPAAADTATTLRAIETYQLSWLVPGLDQDLAQLKEGESLSQEFIFLTKAVYKRLGSDKIYRGYGGKYRLTVRWMRVGGELTPHSD